MNASIRDLKRRVDNVEVPHVDVAGLIASGERRLRRRRAAMATGSAAAVLTLIIGGAQVADRTNSTQDPAKDPSESPSVIENNKASVRQLAYAVGNTIHYGDRSIDVGEYVHFVDVSDDGVAFVRGGGLRAQPAGRALWFTDGSAVERIGTVSGSPARGYEVKASDAGSLIVWEEPLDENDVVFVVFDTRTRQVLTRFPHSLASINSLELDLYPDAVYWVPDGEPCQAGAYDAYRARCLRFRSVMKYDVVSGSSATVSWETYDQDRRSRPRTIVGPYPDEMDVPGTDIYRHVSFVRHGTRLVATDEGGAETAVSEARTGRPVRLQVPAGSTRATYFVLTQWLDDDRFVLFAYTGNATEWADEGDIFSCSVSRETCQVELQGPPGTTYQLPRLD